VSRVLNRKMSFQADIRQRVHHAIETLGLRSEFHRAQHAQPHDIDHRLDRPRDQRSAACDSCGRLMTCCTRRADVVIAFARLAPIERENRRKSRLAAATWMLDGTPM
jgi:hypothetical protein